MLNRRSALMLLSGALATPKTALAATPREITWDDLLPAGVPYSEIIGEGELDEVNDTWNPIYDENATKLNESLDGSYIKMPGFIIPFDIGVKGVTEFMLVPYTGGLHSHATTAREPAGYGERENHRGRAMIFGIRFG